MAPLMQININNPPLSKEDISNLRTDLNNKFNKLNMKRKLFMWAAFFVATIAVALAIEWNAYSGLSPLGFYFKVGAFAVFGVFLSIYSGISIGGGFVIGAFIVAMAAVGAVVGADAPEKIVIVFAGAGFVFGFIGLAFIEKIHNIEFAKLQRKRDGLEYTDTIASIKINNWLDFPEILTFQNAVVNQQRCFLKSEVDAMRDFYNSRYEKLKEIENNIAIEEACKSNTGNK